MNFIRLEKLETDLVILNKVSVNHLTFIKNIFHDTDVRRYYLIPEEYHDNYNALLDEWLIDIKECIGYTWIIYKKGNLFSRIKPCGFYNFEF